MPIDHPSDLPDDDRPRAGDPGQAADEWRAAEDSQAPGGRRPSPAEQAAEQPQPNANGRPDDRSHPSADAPAADRERRDPGEGQTDDQRRAPDRQAVEEARPDARTTSSEAADPPNGAAAEPRTRQEHADVHSEESSGAADARSPEPHLEHAPSQDSPDTLDQSDDEQFTKNADGPGEMEDSRDETLVAEADLNEAEGQADTTPNQTPSNPRHEVSNDVTPDRRADADPLPPDVFDAKDGIPPERQPSLDSDTVADNPVPPLTDAEWAEHVTGVVDDLDKARVAGLTAKRLYTINGAGEVWTEERDSLHESLLNDLYSSAAHVPCEKRAIIAGGLGGAGKTTVLTGHAGIDLSQYMMINPDNIKEEMAKRDMIPAVGALSPMEASDLVHEESSYLAKRLARRAEADGKNIIWDITMSSEDSTHERITNLRSAGYEHIEGVFVDISIETSIRRTDSRHREGHERYRPGGGLGGRYVPEEVIRGQIDSEWGSKNRQIYETMKSRFNHWSVYDNSVDFRDPILVDRYKRD
jgi:predicted ABC-type ATPase